MFSYSTDLFASMSNIINLFNIIQCCDVWFMSLRTLCSNWIFKLKAENCVIKIWMPHLSFLSQINAQWRGHSECKLNWWYSSALKQLGSTGTPTVTLINTFTSKETAQIHQSNLPEEDKMAKTFQSMFTQVLFWGTCTLCEYFQFMLR